MKLHEAITLEEMKREDAMIVLVTDAGRQRVDEMKSLSAVNWIKENRLFGSAAATWTKRPPRSSWPSTGPTCARPSTGSTPACRKRARSQRSDPLHCPQLLGAVQKSAATTGPTSWSWPRRPSMCKIPNTRRPNSPAKPNAFSRCLPTSLAPVDKSDPLEPDTKEALLAS
jgi:hypothetical protein